MFKSIRQIRENASERPAYKSGYSIKHTGTYHHDNGEDWADHVEYREKHYDVHRHGKKVGELTHDDYFGNIKGTLHGKKVKFNPYHGVNRTHPLIKAIQNHAHGIHEMLDLQPHDNKPASGPDVIKRTKAMARNVQRTSQKNKIAALAGKQYEPNRTKARHPATPHQRVTGPNEVPGVTGGGVSEGYHYEPDDAHNTSSYTKWKSHVIKHGAKVSVDPEYHDIENAYHPKHGLVGDFQHTERAYGKGGGYVHPGRIPNFHGKVVNEAFYTDQSSWEEDMREHGAKSFERTETRIIAKKADGDILGAWSVGDRHGITGLGTNIQAEEVQNERDDFDPKEENYRFAEDIKRMVYDQVTANTPVKEAKGYMPTFAQRSPTKQQLKDMSPEERKYHEDANKAYQRATRMVKKTVKQLREGRESEYSANRSLSATASQKRKPGHYLMRHGVALHNAPHATSQQALSAYHNLSDKSNVKIQHVKEDYLPEHFEIGDKVSVNYSGHPRHGQNGDVKNREGDFHHVRFIDGAVEPFHTNRLQKMTARNSAVGVISAAGGLGEETLHEGKYAGYNEHSAAHRAAKSLVTGWKKANRSAVFHHDGSAVVHHHSIWGQHPGHNSVPSTTNVDHALRQLGGWHNNGEKDLENHKQNLPHGIHAHVQKFDDKHVMHLTNGHQAGSQMHPGLHEEGVAMAAGAAGDPGHVQNASDNYAAQRKRQEKMLPKTFRMLRRKKPNMYNDGTGDVGGIHGNPKFKIMKAKE